MTDTEIQAIVGPWLATGLLSDSDRQLLQADFGQPLGECTPCYWNNLKTFYQLKYRKVMKTEANPKYIVDPKVGSFRLFGGQKEIVTLGSENANSIGLTDELAAHLLKEAPDRNEFILVNPDYKEPSAAAARVAAVKADAAKAPAKPATKKAKPVIEKAADTQPAAIETPVDTATIESGDTTPAA